MYGRREDIALVTAADGSATGYSPVLTGRVLAIKYTKDGTTPFSDGVGFTVTLEATAEPIWAEAAVNASALRYPRVGVHDAVGVPATLDGTRLARDSVFCALDRVKVVIASGGNTKNGVVTVVVG